MKEVVLFFRQYETLIYFLLGIGVLRYAVSFWKAWVMLRESIFGLERINAQRQLNQSAITIFLMFVMGFVVFSFVTFIGPNVIGLVGDESNPIVAGGDEILVTPRPITTESLEESDNSQFLPTATPLPTVAVDPAACIPGVIEITFPRSGQGISGVIDVEGVVSVEDFGFFKFEIARQLEALWLPIYASRELVPEEGVLFGNWDTSSYPPDNYVIQLVVSGSSGVELPACRIPIQISSPP